MKEIILSRNKVAVVDDKDFDYLNQYKWYCTSAGYAVRDTFSGGERECLLMHREIMKNSSESIVSKVIDHINHNPLDNRQGNLRAVTHQENILNQLLHKNNTSGHRGISWSKQKNRWRARISLFGRDIHIGFYVEIKDAINAYNEKTQLLLGRNI